MQMSVKLFFFSLSQMNLGEGPQFIAIKVNWLTVNKLNSVLTAKYHLKSDFFKFGGSDPSQQHIVFHLAGPISPQDVANIYEVSNSTELKLCGVYMCRSAICLAVRARYTVLQPTLFSGS